MLVKRLMQTNCLSRYTPQLASIARFLLLVPQFCYILKRLLSRLDPLEFVPFSELDSNRIE